ncbi:MAG TPA: ABC transporter substrate-binding protein, partial [Rhodocyclaceae bacterium]|nr:ABC transporter substrate-binding protein [Rhodocyclaceae bacterium]
MADQPVAIIRRQLCAGLLLLGAATAQAAPTPQELDAARAEGVVQIYAATDQAIVQPLLDDFQHLYPGVRVDYRDMESSEVYERFRRESDHGSSADLAWSSAMDLQIKLVNDGYAQPHRSAETVAVPAWAVWRGTAYGTTFEPVVFAYNKHRVAATEVPHTHAELQSWLAETGAGQAPGRVATYDPLRSGLGFMLHSQDLRANPAGFWSLAEGLGKAGVRLTATTSEMLDAIATGESLIGYNVLGSYALARARRDPAIGVVLPADYTLVVTRIIFIARQARHPNAARLWVDYLLSARGQELLAKRAGLLAVREDLDPQLTAVGLREQLGGAFRPIALGTGLLAYLDRAKQRDF